MACPSTDGRRLGPAHDEHGKEWVFLKRCAASIFFGMEAAQHQRLDTWLWCARFAATRAECARMAQAGLIRINRQPTDKPHARVRVGDMLTLPLYAGVRVVQVCALARRRGSAQDGQALYLEQRPSALRG